MSTLDLPQELDGLVLVVAEGAADAWPTPDDRPISRREVPVAGAAALGLKQDEALLLRPDGHVAWRGARSASTDADAVPLAEAIDRVLALSAE